MALNVLSLGGSRNIGYFTCLRLLGVPFDFFNSLQIADVLLSAPDAGATVSFVLRSPANFDTDETIQKYVQSGHARLIKGDALVETDLRRAWEEAGKDRPVDLLLFTVGGYYSLHHVFLYSNPYVHRWPTSIQPHERSVHSPSQPRNTKSAQYPIYDSQIGTRTPHYHYFFHRHHSQLACQIAPTHETCLLPSLGISTCR